MANTVALSRLQLLYGLCLPLAVLLGFFLADPLEMSALAVVGMVLAVLCSPLLIKCHHPLLIVSWNACLAPAFLPGSPYLWMLITVPSFVLALVARSTDSDRRFLSPSAVTWSLLTLLAVTLLTATLTGGIGIRVLGGDQYGGKRYLYITFSIAGFFALASQGIPRERAARYVGWFFLSGLTALAGHIIYWIGPKAYGLFNLFPPVWAAGQAQMTERVDAVAGGARFGGFTQASVLFLCFLLARYGVRRLFDLARPWRCCLFLGALVGVLYAGFRSALILFALLLAVVFLLEGLHRTRAMIIALVTGALVVVALLPILPRLPYVVQRSLAFLPLPVDPMVRQDVSYSNNWRLEMWKDVLPDLPKYLLMGKGYALDPRDLEIALEGSWRGKVGGWTGARVAGDYHNGPLSVFVPLGGAGSLAFLWFLFAGGRVLCLNCRHGDPALRFINQLLFGCFIARTIFFFAVFGCLWLDLAVFVGLVGFGLSLNPDIWQSPAMSTKLAVKLATGEPAPGQSQHSFK